jgi:uncharacterized membrane protein YagU involved in acid resistance
MREYTKMIGLLIFIGILAGILYLLWKAGQEKSGTELTEAEPVKPESI